MSTILDALRKLEEERHSRTADARARLLLSPPHQTRPLRRQRPSWIAKRNLLSIIGLTVAGFSAGAGFVFWRSDSSQTSSTTTEVVALSPSPTDARHDLPSVPPQSTSQTLQSERKNDSPLLATSTSSLPLPSSSSAEESNTLAHASSVQRSPFTTTAPASQETTSTQREIAPVAKRAPVQTPSAIEDQKQDSSLYEVLLPSGATRTIKPPTPPPTNVAAPTTPSGTALSFLQWSSDPEKRIAFLRVNGGPLTMAHEGDTVGGYTVVEILQNAVELQSGETRMTLRPH